MHSSLSRDQLEALVTSLTSQVDQLTVQNEKLQAEIAKLKKNKKNNSFPLLLSPRDDRQKPMIISPRRSQAEASPLKSLRASNGSLDTSVSWSPDVSTTKSSSSKSLAVHDIEVSPLRRSRTKINTTPSTKKKLSYETDTLTLEKVEGQPPPRKARKPSLGLSPFSLSDKQFDFVRGEALSFISPRGKDKSSREDQSIHSDHIKSLQQAKLTASPSRLHRLSRSFSQRFDKKAKQSEFARKMDSNIPPLNIIALQESCSAIYAKHFLDSPLCVDLPRLASKTTIKQGDEVLFKAQADLSDQRIISKILFSLCCSTCSAQTAKKVRKQFSKIMQPFKGTDTDMGARLTELLTSKEFTECEGTSKVVNILKACTQSILAPVVIHFKLGLASVLSYSSKPHGWAILVEFLEDGLVSVTHTRKEIASTNNPEYEFEWSVRFTFDPSASTLCGLCVTLEDCIVQESAVGFEAKHRLKTAFAIPDAV